MKKIIYQTRESVHYTCKILRERASASFDQYLVISESNNELKLSTFIIVVSSDIFWLDPQKVMNFEIPITLDKDGFMEDEELYTGYLFCISRNEIRKYFKSLGSVEQSYSIEPIYFKSQKEFLEKGVPAIYLKLMPIITKTKYWILVYYYNNELLLLKLSDETDECLEFDYIEIHGYTYSLDCLGIYRGPGENVVRIDIYIKDKKEIKKNDEYEDYEESFSEFLESFDPWTRANIENVMDN